MDNENERLYLSGMRKVRVSSFGKTALLFALFAASLAVAADRVMFTVVDRIQFSVPDNWPVIASKSIAEKTVFAFQIPNAADEGTPDSSNLSIVSSDLKHRKEKDAFEKKASTPAPTAQEKKLVDGWRCSSFSAMQGATQYVDWDCYRVLADCGVFVRMAWPHLPKNPMDYDKQMESILTDFLTSVSLFKKKAK